MPTAYLGAISYYRCMVHASQTYIEAHEHFIKQTFRNRCFIAGPNGKQMLVIPVMKGKTGHSVIKDVQISYELPWQKIHWRSLEAGYRRSPYFEYYEDGLKPFYEKQEKFLLDFNWKLHEKIATWLKWEHVIEKTIQYDKEVNLIDYRLQWPGEHELTGTEYIQVFSARNGFIADLSIVDLLFNEGPHSFSHLLGQKEG
jgi:hypothetical protein